MEIKDLKKLKISIVLIFSLTVMAGCVPSQEINTQEQIMYDAIDKAKENEKDSEELKNQKENITKIKENYSKKEYDFDTPYITVNPYLYNNLSAYIIFDTDEKITYSYSVKSKESSQTPDFTYENKEEQSGTIIIPVVALYEYYDNEVEVTITKGEETKTNTFKIKTEKSPSNYEALIVQRGTLDDNASEADKETFDKFNVKKEESYKSVDVTIEDESVLKYFENGFIMLDTYDVYDLDNNLRFSSPTSILGEGGLKIQDGKFIIYNENRSRGYLADVMGKIHSELKLVNSGVEGVEDIEFHHDAVITPDNKYIYTLAGFREFDYEDIPEGTEGDFILESFILKYDISGGYPIAVFDTTDYFKDGTINDVDGNLKHDPIHNNSIDYYEEKNEIILSSKRQSMIYAINGDNGNLDWFFKQEDQIEGLDEEKLIKITNEDEFIYPSGNHTVFEMNTEKYKTDAQNLYISVFNNNNCLEAENKLNFTNQEDAGNCNWSEYSSMIIYNIDTVGKTITFEEEIIPDDTRWSYIMSSVFTNHKGIYELNYTMQDLDNGQQLFNPSLLIIDEEGNIMMSVEYYGLGIVYRSRVIIENEIYDSLLTNIKNI